MPDVFEMLNSSIYAFYGADSSEQAFKLSTQAHSVLEEFTTV